MQEESEAEESYYAVLEVQDDLETHDLLSGARSCQLLVCCRRLERA